MMLSTIKTYIISSLLLCSLLLCLLLFSVALTQDSNQTAEDTGISAPDVTQATIVTFLDLPSMSKGTQIQIVSPDLTINFGLASVIDGELILETELEPYDEVRLLISHAGTGEVAMPTAFVSKDGDDLMLHIPDITKSAADSGSSSKDFVSFREWLSRERGLRMIFPRVSASN